MILAQIIICILFALLLFTIVMAGITVRRDKRRKMSDSEYESWIARRTGYWGK